VTGNPTVYEINTVLWLRELSATYSKTITLGSVPSREWDKIKRFKFDYVWLMGVWKRSVAGRKIAQRATEMFDAYNRALPGWAEEDIAGSPYSIQGYEPDPSVGDWDDLQKAREQLDRRGTGLILDLIPNHTGVDHPWVRRSPENYLQGSESSYNRHPDWFFPVTVSGRTRFLAKGRDPFFPPWNDTLQLNYFSPGYRRSIKRVIGKLGGVCDGLRCDMTMLGLNEIFRRTWQDVLQPGDDPTEFWEEVLASSPRLLWIAEAYWNTEWKLQNLGFDIVYDKVFYDRVRWSPAPDIVQHLRADPSFQNRLVRFLENHDEDRSATTFGPDRLRAAVVLLCSVPGMKLFHQGQLEGRTVKIPVQLVRAMEERTDPETEAFYLKILPLFRSPVCRHGEWRLLTVEEAGDGTEKNLIASSLGLGKEMRLVVVNMSAGWAQGRIRFEPPGEDRGTRKQGDKETRKPERTYTLTDQMTGEKYVRNSDETISLGLHVLLEPHQAHVFDIKPSPPKTGRRV